MHTYFKLKTWPYQNFNYRNYKSTFLPSCSTGLKKVIQIVPELNRFKCFHFSPLNHDSGNMAWFLHNVVEHTNKRQRSHIQLGEGITPEPKLHDVRFLLLLLNPQMSPSAITRNSVIFYKGWLFIGFVCVSHAKYCFLYLKQIFHNLLITVFSHFYAKRSEKKPHKIYEQNVPIPVRTVNYCWTIVGETDNFMTEH